MTRANELRAMVEAALQVDRRECLIWPHATYGGYPWLVFDGKTRGGHRVVCEMVHGKPFEGAYAAHKCGNPKCINPNCLYWATPKQNSADKIIHGTTNRGSRSAFAKLSETDALKIIAADEAGVRQKDLAKKYGVSHHTIHSIVQGKNWAHLRTSPFVKVGRGVRHCGVRNPKAKITLEIAEAIRFEHAKGETRAALARKHNINWSTVNRIIKYEIWK